MIFSISFFVIVTISLLLVDMYIQRQNHFVAISAILAFIGLSAVVLDNMLPVDIKLHGFLPVFLPLFGLIIAGITFNILVHYEDTHHEVVQKMRLWVKFAIPTFTLFFCWLCIAGEIFFGWNMPFSEITFSLENGY